MAFFKLILYNFQELMTKLVDSRVVWMGLGEQNGGELDAETKMKVVGDVVIIWEEA